VTLIPGDGIGPEVTEATTRVLDATGVSFQWDVQHVGAALIESVGSPLPDSVIDSIRRNQVALKGPVGTPVGTGFPSVNVTLRKKAGLHANIRPCKSYDGVPSRYRDVDLVIVRDATEDIYSGIEFAHGTPAAELLRTTILQLDPAARIADGSGITIKPISVEASRRVAEVAFSFARAHGRRRVTAVHKANLMKATDGLFLAVAKEVASQNTDIEFDDRIVDNLCAELVQRPEEFDVLLCPMQYGDILSDLAAGLIGGVGIAPGMAVGTEAALFEPGHGSAPKHAGKNRVNPVAMMLSGVLLLRHLGECDAADRLEGAISSVIVAGGCVTYDLKVRRDDPTAVGTSAFADAVVDILSA
jgi:isocitrate dehydrogenase (NAD+)